MKAREVYNKVYANSKLPVALIGFTTKDKDGVIQLGGVIPIDFRDFHEVNIKKMLTVEKRKGFMFWNNSDDGEKFFRSNAIEINKLFAEMVLSQSPMRFDEPDINTDAWVVPPKGDDQKYWLNKYGLRNWTAKGHTNIAQRAYYWCDRVIIMNNERKVLDDITFTEFIKNEEYWIPELPK
jgi:hypothetical protein